MKQITLQVEDEQYSAFLSFIKTLSYVKINSNEEIANAHIEEINRRLELIESGKMKVRGWDAAKEELFE